MDLVLDGKTAARIISANLRARLAKLGLSQQDLADRSGLQKMTISYIVRGRVSPNIVTLAKIAAAVDMTVDDLIMP